MRAPLLAAALAAAGCSQPASPPPPPPPPAPESARTWDFEGDAEGSPPAGFTFARTGTGRPGLWVVRPAKDAPSGGRVLVQEDEDATDSRFPLALVEGIAAADLRLSVRCRMVSGVVDRAAGLVFRCRGGNDYYLARANALEGNVRLYAVVDGARRTLASWDGEISAGTWHELAVEAKGDLLRVHFDGKQVLEARDATFPGPGGVGLWTKADSLTQFDDLDQAGPPPR